jgi:hypothetical protein
MRVLVACEFSGVVREAFRKKGHEAWSCDLLPSEDGSEHHFQIDVLTLLRNTKSEGVPTWDLMVAHPPCTHLASSGARWWKDKEVEQSDAVDFVYDLAYAQIDKIAIENPVGYLSTAWRKPDQIIQPWVKQRPPVCG